MSWIDTSEYDRNDMCPICYKEYGTSEAIYKTRCNHTFHNDCLNGYCEYMDGEIVCPICRSDVEYACMDVWAFKNHMLGNTTGGPLFNGNEHLLEIYNNQRGGTRGGRRYKRSKKTAKTAKRVRKTNRRNRTIRKRV